MGDVMEDLLKEVSRFSRENLEALNPAIQWLNNEFDGELEDVWISAVNPFDWRKVVFIAWLGSDEKIYECKLEIDGFDLRQWCGCDRKEEDIELTPQQDFLYGVISRVEGGYYTTPKNPSFYLIRRALNEGKKAVKDGKIRTTPDIKEPQGEIAALIYEKLKTLPEHKAMNLPMIAQWLYDEHKINIDESTIRTNHIPQLIPYGLHHKRRIGYCLR